MTDAPPPVATAIRRLADEVVERARADTGALPTVEHDPDWPSPCIAGPVADGRVPWHSVPMARAPDFGRLARALEVPIHTDLVQYFGTVWSAPLPVRFEGNELELLQLWNEQDFEHLLANLIGHALEKKRVRQPLSLFFALVDDDRFLSLDNQSGAVGLETVGLRTVFPVTPTLSEFLHRVEVRTAL